jgi:hypothetical protein
MIYTIVINFDKFAGTLILNDIHKINGPTDYFF